MNKSERTGFERRAGRPPGQTVKTKMRAALPAAQELIIKHSKSDLLAAIAVSDYCKALDQMP